MRIDKWLWAVRLYKTRTMATEACRKGKVIINELTVKPSRMISIGEVIQIKHPPIIRSYRVLGIIGKRVSAKLAAENIENLTPEEELDRFITMKNSAYISREKGSGRPTKKERRTLDNISIKQQNNK